MSFCEPYVESVPNFERGVGLHPVLTMCIWLGRIARV